MSLIRIATENSVYWLDTKLKRILQESTTRAFGEGSSRVGKNWSSFASYEIAETKTHKHKMLIVYFKDGTTIRTSPITDSEELPDFPGEGGHFGSSES